MEKANALEFVKKAIAEELPHLKGLNRENDEYPLWFQKMQDILEAAFGKNSNEYEQFAWAVRSHRYWGSEQEFQQEYVDHLREYELVLKSIFQKYEILGIPTTSTVSTTGTPPGVFIAHGGESQALDKLVEFLKALGTEPIVVEKAPSQGRSVGENVDWCLNCADCAVILATKGDIDGKTGHFMPRGNVLIEVGKCEERFPDKVVYLLEEDASFPSNVSEKVWERFRQDNMDGAFIKIARELVAFGLLKATKSV